MFKEKVFYYITHYFWKKYDNKYKSDNNNLSLVPLVDWKLLINEVGSDLLPKGSKLKLVK
jgi:hypothetical protein